MKRRSNLRTALIGVGGATTTSVSKRGAAKEQLRLAAKAAEGEGARFGRGPIKTARSSPDSFAVHPRRGPRGECTNAAPKLDVQTAFTATGLPLGDHPPPLLLLRLSRVNHPRLQPVQERLKTGRWTYGCHRRELCREGQHDEKR